MELYIVRFWDAEGYPGIILNLEINDLNSFVEAYDNGEEFFFFSGRNYNISKTVSVEIFDVTGWEGMCDPSDFILLSYNGYYNDDEFYQKELLPKGKLVTKKFISGLLGHKNSQPKKQTKVMKKNSSSPRIFISHSTKDWDIVNGFIDNILILSFGLTREQIFCSSVTGTGIKSGADFKNVIKEELQNANAVIQIISKDYKQSEVCLNEMGAAWVLTDTIIPLVIPPQNYDVGFLNCSIQQLKINDEQNLHQLFNDHKGGLFPESIDTGVFNEKIREFIEFVNACIICRQGESIDTNLFFNEQVKIQGVFRIGIFAGPPGYGENPESDSYHRYYYIEVDSVVNVLSSDMADVDGELQDFSYFGVDKIQLVIHDFAPFSPIERFKNKRVLVVGELFSGHTGWHQTKVLINTTRLELA